MTQMPTKQRLFLLDAYALIYRAYYALIKNPITDSKGFNTSAIYGFVNTLEELLRKQKPTHIAVCFDPHGPTFRHEAMPQYKAQRPDTPEDIKASIPVIKQILHAYGIPVIQVDGYEADDVMGTLATEAARQGMTTYIMTPDKDLGQLVGPRILQYKPSYRSQDMEIRGEEEVCSRYNISAPHQIIDLLALMGDKIDNIPGCPGIGEKTARKLIAQFGSVEVMLNSTDQLKGALRKKIEDNVDLIRDSYYLATICTDVPLQIQPGELSPGTPDIPEILKIFRRYQFRTLEKRMLTRLGQSDAAETDATVVEATADTTTPATAEDVVTTTATERVTIPPVPASRRVDTPQMQKEMMQRIAPGSSIAIHLDTEGDNDITAQWRGTAIATDSEHTYYIPADYAPAQAALLDLMAAPDIRKITTNAKRDYVMAALQRHDTTQPLTNYYDITLAHYLLQPEHPHDLTYIAGTYLHQTSDNDSTHTDATASVAQPSLFDNMDPFADTSAAGETDPNEQSRTRCAYLTLQLEPILHRQIEQQQLHDLLQEIEQPLAAVLAQMELAGVRIDVKALQHAADDLRTQIAALQQQIYTQTGTEFNIDSPSQVGDILFGRLQLDPNAKKTKTGHYSTNDTILEKLASRHPVVDLIRRYRQMRKLLNTYLTTLPQNINPRTQHIHTNYNQTATATGRLSSSNPNLQNIPVREELGREIRRAFIPAPGCVFLSADYSQIELRIVADISQDATMIEAFRQNRDIHTITASKIYNVPADKVTPEQRRHAKTANFGILYGITAFGLAQRLNIPRRDAQQLIDGYAQQFPAIQTYIQKTLQQAETQGYVTTIKGRKRMQPDINSRNAVVRGYARRNAINAPIQGSAADIIKIAMISISAEIQRRGLQSRMIMQVHDELNFNVPEDEVVQMQELVQRNMQAAYTGDVPLTVSLGIGPDWLTAH